MIYISHRGNITGKDSNRENTIEYINEALSRNFYVEVDIRSFNMRWYLGHDTPQEEVDNNFLNNKKIFVHAKNSEALLRLTELNLICEYFWHNVDDYTLTSNANVWVYPNKPLLKNSFCVLPEQGYNGNINLCKGICSDNIDFYKNKQILS